MKLPRVRFTLRRMMLAVAAVAVVLWLITLGSTEKWLRVAGFGVIVCIALGLTDVLERALVPGRKSPRSLVAPDTRETD
jgi:hypothetical protein